MHEPTTPTRNANRRSWPLTAVLIVWIVAVLAGWYGISSYGFSFDPDATTGAPAQWPAESTIVRSGNRPTLLLFLHPQCPCSRATVAELERLNALVPAQLLPQIFVVAAAPRAVGELWQSTPLLSRAGRLPNARVLHDAGGVETALFDARVSGAVLLFSVQGDRLYAGGVTMARGHDGHNAGLQAVTDLLIDHAARRPAIPPFGCDVYREDSDESRDDDDPHRRRFPDVGGAPA